MGKLTVFNFITLDGYYKGPNEDVSWHHQHSAQEENKYASKALKSESTLLFGRVTYEMMIKYWPTEQALKDNPKVAKGMNKAKKIVFSKTLKQVEWSNTRIINENIGEEVRKLKKKNNMTLLGSGSILTQLAEQGLIDEYQIMLDPLAIGNGTSIFKNINHKLELKLRDIKEFKSGIVLLLYKPIKN